MNTNDLLEGLPGLRDFFPEDWSEIDYVLDKMRTVSKKYAYEEYEGPGIEAVELIEAKSGEGLIKEIFKLKDRNDRNLLLRPEQTPTLAKMLAREQQRYKRPIRWFSIPRLFRDETVQKGRVREFWQLNVDILGEERVSADAETIAVGVEIIRACGIPDDEFNVYVNHRELLNNYISEITDIKPDKVIPVIDKKMSLFQEQAEIKLQNAGLSEQDAREQALLLRRYVNSGGDFKSKLESQLNEEANALLSDILTLISSGVKDALLDLGLENNQVDQLSKLISLNGSPGEFLSKLEELSLPESCNDAVEELSQLAKYLDAYGVSQPIVFDASMARGLDYYTGIVYEAFDATGEVVRAIFGGGRYSDLVEALGGTKLSGVGFGMGETVILELMKARNIFEELPKKSVDLYLAPIKAKPIPKLIELSQRLKESFDVLCNPFSWKLGRHFEYADSKNAKIVLLLGQRDIDNGVVSVREMETSEQYTFDMDDTLEAKLQELLDQ